MSDLAQARETGAQKSETTCTNCGEAVPVVETAYGSTAPGACPKCWPQAEGSQLDAQEKAAEKKPRRSSRRSS
jgi:uncharacterized Zn finger protein (UPF0148 family)